MDLSPVNVRDVKESKYQNERQRFTRSMSDFFQRTKYNREFNMSPEKQVDPKQSNRLMGSKERFEDYKRMKEQVNSLNTLKHEKRFLGKRERLLETAW